MRKRRPRIRGFTYTGKFQYFLTLCTAERNPLFEDTDLAQRVATQILRDATAYSFAVPAYVVMKDHTHWLVEGLRDDSALRPFVKMAKQRSGHMFRQQTGRPLWQSSYFDVIIRDDVQTLEVICYIVNNPVRAGLVSAASDYPSWGSGTATREEILALLSSRPAQTWRPAESISPTL